MISALLPPTEDADEHLRLVADTLHPVFAANSPEERLRILNGRIAELDPTPTLTANGHGWSVSDRSYLFMAAMLLVLAEHARSDPRLQRLGTCQAHSCVDAFHDRGRTGNPPVLLPDLPEPRQGRRLPQAAR